MEIKFEHLSIKNFKSIDDFELDFGKVTTIYGANEAGKTSVADAISWVLTGKNSLGESTFNIVPVGSIGVSPAVELKLSIGSKGTGYCKKPTLKRVLKAKQARDRSFTGEYQTECYINDVKYTQKDFEDWINSEICTPEVFRLIHDVRYFTENISVKGKERPWEARRRLLTGLCGLDSDYQIALSDERFKWLADKFTIYTNSSEYFSKLKSTISGLERDLDVANRDIERWENDKKSFENEPQVFLFSSHELEQQRDKLNDEFKKMVAEGSKRIAQYQKDCKAAGEKVVRLSGNVQTMKNNISITEANIDMETKNYNRYGESCPTCGRKFARGFSEKRKQEYEYKVSELKQFLKGYYEELDKLNKQYQREQERYEELLKAGHNKPDELAKISQKIAEINSQLAPVYKREQRIKTCEENIEKAKKNIEGISKQLSEKHRELDLLRDFISYKCQYVQEKVNSLFDGIEFVMFRENKTNDEIRECCDIKWHGVDYNDLSYSTKFVVSLLIVQGFQRSFSVCFPVVVDNSESIDTDYSMCGQILLLAKRSKPCPKCGYFSGRKQADGYWHCEKCGEKFTQPLEVEITPYPSLTTMV